MNCQICQKPFIPKQKNQVRCSNHECMKAYKRNFQRDMRKTKLTTKACIVCGAEYTGGAARKTCGDECSKEHTKRLRKECSKRHNATPNAGTVRPYDEHEIRSIVTDLMRGWALSTIAEIRKRDKDDVRRFVQEIEQDGTKAKWEKRLMAYQRV